jgi:DHA1 family bicyclomycin/chloramphenicol resistance-like MFS transporter
MTLPRALKISGIAIVCLANMMFSNELPLPALPNITQYFLTTTEITQMSVAINLLGIAIFALIHGPLSDVYGRKQVLLYALFLYVIFTLICPFVGTIEQLVAVRFLQGCCGGASTVIGLCMVTDEFSGPHNTQMLSRIMLASVAASIAAPIIGGHLTVDYGWQSVFFFMALYGMFCWVLVYFCYTENCIHEPRHHSPPGSKLKEKLLAKYHLIFEGFSEMLHHRDFMYAVTIHGSLYCGKWIYATVAPFIFIQSLGLSPVVFGYYTAAVISAFIFCSLLTEFTIHKIGNLGVIQKGLLIASAGACMLLLIILFFPDKPGSIAFAASLYIGAAAMLTPSGATLAMDFSKKKGAAAAILASSRTFMGVLGATLGGIIREDHFIMMPIVLFITIAIPGYMLFQLQHRQKKHA